MFIMLMWFTLDNSLTSSRFMSIVQHGGNLFCLPVLKVISSLSLEDQTNDNKLHVVYDNIFVPLLSLTFHNTRDMSLLIFHLYHFSGLNPLTVSIHLRQVIC